VAQTRALGADISYWNCGSSATGISQENWNIACRTGHRVFVFLRATRGGTTGVDQPQGTPGGGNLSTLARRYDDPRFVQNLVRATAAGMHLGPYHFARPDVAGNTGTDEANHFIQMAGAWMRPGYLVPVFDLEAGQSLGGDALAQFALDFSDRLHAVLRIRPCIYVNGSYSGTLQAASASRRDLLAKPGSHVPGMTSPAFPVLWNARYADNSDPESIPVQTGSPKHTYSTYAGYYGPWDDYGNTEPWALWQYASTVSIPGFNAVDATCDGNVAHGDLEYVRNLLVPAVWWNDQSGDWSTLSNWNSGQVPTAPVTPAGQTPPYATGGLPAPRLPGAAGTGPTSGQHDTVILERPNANITVTLSAGTHSIRKLYMRESLNLTGGSLRILYDPAYRPDNSPHVLHAGPVSAQFSGPVTLSANASLSVSVLRVDAGHVFTLTGGTLALNTIQLMPQGSAPARILLGGQSILRPLAHLTARIVNGAGAGSSGWIDLGGGPSRTLTVGDEPPDVDLSLEVPVNNGALTKAGAGTLSLGKANGYHGGTTLLAGRLLVNNSSGSGTGSGGVTVSGGTLGGTGTVAGAILVESDGAVAPGTSSTLGRLTLQRPPTLLGTTFMRIDRNGGAPHADQLSLASGVFEYGGALVVSNSGAALLGGEAFTLFPANARAGAFSATNLPPLEAGLNWYLGQLTSHGILEVNRRPVVASLAFTNIAPAVLRIPLTALASSATDPDGDTLAVGAVDTATAGGVPLANHEDSLVYSNRVSVTDGFSYEVDDGRGGSSRGWVTIVNIGSSPAAQFDGAPSMTSTSARLRFSATPGWHYTLERSTNLTHWTAIWSAVAPASGAIEHTDEFRDLPAPPPASFYRLRWEP